MDGRIASELKSLPLVSKPPVESFSKLHHALAVWPKAITLRHDFFTQISSQEALVHSVRAIFAVLPVGSSIEQGLDADLITEEMVVNFYDNLATYLTEDPANQRLVLYFPLELTGPIAGRSAALTAASDRFQKAFRAAWEAQLLQHDVRANFVDGDVLEFTLRTEDLPRVVKATHLIPGLVQSGHMTFTEVTQYAANSEDSLLKDGVSAACEVLYASENVHGAKQVIVSVDDALSDLTVNVAKAAKIDPPGSTPNRKKWLRKDATEKAVACAATKLSQTLIKGTTLPDITGLDSTALCACIDAVRLCALQKHELQEQHQAWLAAVQNHTHDEAVQDTVRKLYLHLYAVGIIDLTVLTRHRIRFPMLQGPFSSNLDHLTPSLCELTDMTAQIVKDEYLAARLYPVMILFGSQLKGYGISDADADVAVFIQPGVPMEEQPQIAERLKHIFAHERIGGDALLLWLDEEADSLTLRENTQAGGGVPLSSLTHVLMGGAWIGTKNTIHQLQHSLLTPYLFNPTEVLDGKPVRERWLEEMERDSIQYRLLHKGFARYYPVQSPMNTVHGEMIDGSTAFYDPQFRRIATELFLTRVFFPNLG